MMIALDSDVAQGLWAKANRLGISFDQLGDRILRDALRAESGPLEGASELPEDWYSLLYVDGVDIDLPGLYEWRVDDRPVYVGFYTKKTTATQAYTRNLRNLIRGLPYRAGKPDAFRHIHYVLREAVTRHQKITLCFLENADSSELTARRNFLQRS